MNPQPQKIDTDRRIVLEIPIVTRSELNWRGHWSKRASRFKKQKEIVWAHWHQLEVAVRHDIFMHVVKCRGRVRVELTRWSVSHTRLDDDNLRGSLKAVRDELAKQIGIDDGDPRIEFLYEQAAPPFNWVGVGVVVVLVDYYERKGPGRQTDQPGPRVAKG